MLQLLKDSPVCHCITLIPGTATSHIFLAQDTINMLVNRSVGHIIYIVTVPTTVTFFIQENRRESLAQNRASR